MQSVGDQKLDAGEKITPTFVTFDEYKDMKDSPDLRGYHDDVFEEIDCLDELLDLPTLHDYS